MVSFSGFSARKIQVIKACHYFQFTLFLIANKKGFFILLLKKINLNCTFFHYHLVPLYLPFPQQSPHCCSCPRVLCPFCSILYLLTPPPLLAVIFSPSMGLSLFCLLIQFVHYISHMSEIIWYLSFSDCLISLSIMFSRSVHTVAKGKIFFFFTAK